MVFAQRWNWDGDAGIYRSEVGGKPMGWGALGGMRRIGPKQPVAAHAGPAGRPSRFRATGPLCGFAIHVCCTQGRWGQTAARAPRITLRQCSRPVRHNQKHGSVQPECFEVECRSSRRRRAGPAYAYFKIRRAGGYGIVVDSPRSTWWIYKDGWKRSAIRSGWPRGFLRITKYERLARQLERPGGEEVQFSDGSIGN